LEENLTYRDLIGDGLKSQVETKKKIFSTLESIEKNPVNEEVEEEEPEHQRWDCETILSKFFILTMYNYLNIITNFFFFHNKLRYLFKP